MDIVKHGPTEIWNEHGSWARLAFLALVEPRARDARERLFGQREPIAPYFHEPHADSETHGTQLRRLWEWMLDSPPVDPFEYAAECRIMCFERPFDMAELWPGLERERSLDEDEPWFSAPAPYTLRSLELSRAAHALLDGCPDWFEGWLKIDPVAQLASYIATGALPQMLQAQSSATGQHLMGFGGPFHRYEKVTIEVFDPETVTGEDVKRLYEAALGQRRPERRKRERRTEELAAAELRLVLRRLEALLRAGHQIDPQTWEWRPKTRELNDELRVSGQRYFMGKLSPQARKQFQNRVGFWRYRPAIEQTVLGFQQCS